MIEFRRNESGQTEIIAPQDMLALRMLLENDASDQSITTIREKVGMINDGAISEWSWAGNVSQLELHPSEVVVWFEYADEPTRLTLDEFAEVLDNWLAFRGQAD